MPAPRSDGFAAPGGAPIFEYVGATALSAIGSATGREYRFARPGARLQVDPRDQTSLARVPRLRRIVTHH